LKKTLDSKTLFGFSVFSLVLFGAMFVYITVRQTLYPAFTEPMEGDVLQHIARIARGLKPYPEATGEFIPLAHMPLLYFLSAPLYALLGDSLAGPRLISSFCAIASGLVVGRITWEECRDKNITILAMAIYYSNYYIMDANAACALPDSLMLLLILTGSYFLAYGKKKSHDFAGIVLLCLAFWAKQHGAIYAGFGILFVFLCRNSRTSKWLLAAVFVIGIPVAYVAAEPLMGEAFFYHTFFVPGSWDKSIWFSVRRTVFLLACYAPMLTFLSVVYLLEEGLRTLRKPSPLAWFVVGAFLSSGFTMMAAGSSNNHYIPLIAFMSITAAMGLRTLSRSAPSKRLTLLTISTAIVSISAGLLSAKLFSNHYVPLYQLLFANLLLIGAMLVVHKSSKTVFAVILLAVAHFSVVYFNPSMFLPESGYERAALNLQAELQDKQEVIYLPYGNTPEKLLQRKLLSAPSWVALEDIERKAVFTKHDQEILDRFKTHILSFRNLYLMSDVKLEHLPVWKDMQSHFELVQEYGARFLPLRMIAKHWFVGRSYPRYLYHRKKPSTS